MPLREEIKILFERSSCYFALILLVRYLQKAMMLKLVRTFPSKAKTTDDSNTTQEYRYTNTTQKSILQMESPGILYLRSLDTRSDNYCCLSYLLLNSIILVTGIFCELQFKASVHCKLCMRGKAESFYYANNDNSLFYHCDPFTIGLVVRKSFS